MTDRTIDMTDDANILELYHRISKNEKELNNILTINNGETKIDDLDLQLVEKLEWKPKEEEEEEREYIFKINDKSYTVLVNDIMHVDTYINQDTGKIPENWSQTWDTGDFWEIQNDTTFVDDKKLVYIEGGGRVPIIWNEIGKFKDIEIAFEVNFGSIGQSSTDIAFIRTNDVENSDNGTGYIIRTDNNGSDIRLDKIVDGDSSEITSSSWNHTSNTLYNFRFQVFGNKIKARAWNASDDEPNSWNISTTDEDIDEEGYIGFGDNRGRGYEYGWISWSEESEDASILND